MLGFAEKLHFSLLWLSDFRIISEDSYSPHAYEDVINVFVFDWASMINSFPDLIPKRSRASVIRSHSENTDMFTLSSLRKFRQRRILKLTFLLSRDFWSSMHLKMQDVIASVLIPNFALRSLQETSTGSEAK